MTPIVFGADGNRVKLGARIGGGGEGDVYTVEGSSDRAVKIYTITDKSSREAKVRKMIAGGLHQKSKLIAFPIALLRDTSGRFAGFTMEKVTGHKALHDLYAPGARKAEFPSADYRFLVRASTNIARAVGMAHATGCVIGDINHSGILVSDRATATLIDADSFQFFDGTVRFPCLVGVPEYTPPELHGQRLERVVRTHNHDAFGLAIVIFQLLWMGRHPFAGKPQGRGDVPIEKAIREYRFAYSQLRSVGFEAPPGAPKLSDFPVPMAAAFEQAFGPTGVRERPTAKQWVTLLEEFERSLRACSINSLHYFAKDTRECPWCRMERTLGVLLFIPNVSQFEHGAGFAPTIGDIVAIWRAIDAIPAPPSAAAISSLQSSPVPPSAEAIAAKNGRWERKAIGVGLLTLGGVILVAALITAPSLAILALVAGGFGVAQLTKQPSNKQQFVQRYKEIEKQLLSIHQRQTSDSEFLKLKASLAALKNEFDCLPAEEQRRVEAYNANRRDEHLKAFLDTFQIRHFKIAQIGPAKLAILTSYGIETAAHVSSVAVLKVPGFGPTNSKPLLKWRADLARRFTYNPNPSSADRHAISSIKAGVARRGNEIRAELGTGPERLTKLTAAIRQSRSAIESTLQRLREQRAQAIADLNFLGLPIPGVSVPRPPARASPTLQPSTRAVQQHRCPRCGGPMVLRTARRGWGSGRQFYGCQRFPLCRGTRPGP
jgi:DNA-binding helix-hairpin-helix protein with protein kinase domain